MAWFIGFGLVALVWWIALVVLDLRTGAKLHVIEASGVLAFMLFMAAALASLANLVSASFNNVYVPNKPVHIVGKVLAHSEDGYTTLNAVGADRHVYEAASFTFGHKQNNTVVVYKARPANLWLSLWSNEVAYTEYNIDPADLEIR